MSRKKKAIFIVAIVSTIVLAFIGGQTFSKYVAEVRGDGIAEVATWSFKVNGQQEEVQTINLGSTCNDETLIGNKIAPGTSGSFNIMVDGTGSDVGIDYRIEFQNNLSGTIHANDEDKTRNLTIDWKWDYETGTTESEIANNDKMDTQNAKDIANYTFNVIVSGTQVVPNT